MKLRNFEFLAQPLKCAARPPEHTFAQTESEASTRGLCKNPPCGSDAASGTRTSLCCLSYHKRLRLAHGNVKLLTPVRAWVVFCQDYTFSLTFDSKTFLSPAQRGINLSSAAVVFSLATCLIRAGVVGEHPIFLSSKEI